MSEVAISSHIASLAAIPGSDSLLELVHLLRDPRAFFHKRVEAYGPVFKTRLIYPVVFLVGAEANKTIMVTKRHEFSMGQGYGQTAVRRVFEGSIMLEDGEQHDRTRGILTPAVGRLALSESSDSVRAIWGDNLRRAANGKAQDCYDIAQGGTFDVAANALTGLELGAETDRFRPYFIALMEGIMAPTNLRVPFRRLDRALKARAKLIEMFRPRIEKARRAEPQGLVGQMAHYKDEAGNYMPADEISAHLLLLFWAGYDTTASAGAWILQKLAERADWVRILRQDLDDNLGSERLNAENHNAAAKLAWFLKEIERMYPSALFFPRLATEDIDYAGYRIPEGTPVFYTPYMTHRDPAEFDLPNNFDPSRWDPDDKSRSARPAALVGFGGGPRICLGKHFALLQLKIMIEIIVRDYEIEPDPKSRSRVRGLPVHHPKDSHFFLRPRS